MADGKKLNQTVNAYKAAQPNPKWNGMLKLDAFDSQEPAAPAPVPTAVPAPVQGLELSPDAEGPALDREGRMREMLKALRAGQAKRKAIGGI
jgi:hypothetical protein